MGVEADTRVVQQKKSTGFCRKYIIDSFPRTQSRLRQKLNVNVTVYNSLVSTLSTAHLLCKLLSTAAQGTIQTVLQSLTP